MLQDREIDVSRMTYSPFQPVDIIFTALDDLADFAELDGAPITERQIVQKAYLLLNRTQRFKEPIREWNRREPA